MASQQHSLPPDVQENIVHNIQKIFPNYVDKKIIRAVLNRECWDLEKSLSFLKSSLNSFNDNPNNSKKKENKVKKFNQSKQIPKKNKMENCSNTTSGPSKPPELLKNFKRKPRSKPNAKPQNSEKPKGDSFVQGDWVLVNEPGSQSSKVQDTSKDKNKNLPAENKSQANDKKLAKRKLMMQHYELIKQFGEPLNRISAYINEGIKVMILLRGCSGSGKTTYANQLLKKHGAKNHQCHIFSADNYFINKEGKYIFNYDLLQNAHAWNQKLVRLAVTEGRSPIFVDNTNTRLWEMKDYAIMAVEFGYIIETLEPPTPWFFNEDLLFRKTLHNVPRETIKKMLDRYEANVSGEDVLRALKLNYGSVAPPQFVIAGMDIPMSKKHTKVYNERLELSTNLQNKSVARSKSTKPSDSPQFRSTKSLENSDNSRFSSSTYKPVGNMPVQENNPVRFGRPGPYAGNSNPATNNFFGPGNPTMHNQQVHYPPQFFGPNNGPYMTAAVPNVFNSQFHSNFIPNTPPSEFYRPINRPPSGAVVDNASGNKMVTENIMDTTPPYVEDLIDLTVPMNVETINDLKESPPFSSEMSSSISLLEGLKIEGGVVLDHSDSDSDDEEVEDEEEDEEEESLIEDSSGSLSDGGEESSTSYMTAATTTEPASSEYVLIHDEEVLFQKTHDELTDIKTLEDFRTKTSSSSFSQNFEDFLFQYMENSRSGTKVNDVSQNNIEQEENKVCTESNQTCMDGKTDKGMDDDSIVMTKRVRPTTSLGEWSSKDVLLEKPINFLPKDQRVQLPQDLKKISNLSVSTNTNYLDFETLREVNNGVIAENVKILNGSPFFQRAISNIPFLPATVLMLDKGVMTSDIETSQVIVRDSGIERLALMFPGIARENLEELFDKCQKDIDWTVGLLLDSGQEMSELYSSLEPIECEAYDDSIRYPNENSDVKESEVHFGEIKKQKKKKNDQESNKYKEMQESIQNNFILGENHYSEKMKKHIERKHKIQIGTHVGIANADSPETPVSSEDVASFDSQTEGSDSEEDGVFMMDSDFIFQLQSRFGGLLRPNMIGEKTVVSIPSSLARQLHSYIMDSILQQIEGEDIFTDNSVLEKDEELARSLQEEELKSRGVRSLLEIMDEEVALKTTSQKDGNSGKSMASTLSKQLLIERFPRMDPATLALILEDTNHSLHEATCLLSSAGHFQAEPNQETEQNDPLEPKKNTLTREEAIKQADAYGDVASKLYEMRKDCLKKAQDAYREGNSSVALYYSEMARWYMERIEKSNSLAAKAILSGYEGWTTLDLHFLQVSEALNVLDLFVDEVIRELHESKNKKAIVYIITGRGLHSAGGRPRLKPAVQSRLLKRDLRYVEQNPGMLRVTIPRTAMTSYNREVAVCA